MAEHFADYQDAASAARRMADRAGIEVAIRKVVELGTPGFNVSYASVNDSDYAKAEIVKPGTPGPRVAAAPSPWSPSETAWKKMERFSDARTLVRVTVPIAELPVARPETLPRAANIPKLVEALAAGSKDVPPVFLGRDALGKLDVHDGRHRIAAPRRSTRAPTCSSATSSTTASKSATTRIATGTTRTPRRSEKPSGDRSP